jgi:transcriptional regulator with XRE-family HTH domain
MNLRTARRLKDITQAQLAQQSGVDQTTISDIERGRNRNPSWETVVRISRALGVEPHEIFPVPASTQGAA